jgi:signal transduction histidine kinase
VDFKVGKLSLIVKLIPTIGMVLSLSFSAALYFQSKETSKSLGLALVSLKEYSTLSSDGLNISQYLTGITLSIAANDSELFAKMQGGLLNSLKKKAEGKDLYSTVENLTPYTPLSEVIQLLKSYEAFNKSGNNETAQKSAQFQKHFKDFSESHEKSSALIKLLMVFLTFTVLFSSWLSKKLDSSLSKIEESEKLYRMLFSSLKEGILLIRKDGRIITANSSAEILLKIPKEDLKKIDISMIFPTLVDSSGNGIRRGKSPFLKMSRSKKTHRDLVIGVSPEPGIIKWLNFCSTPFNFDSEGEVETSLFTVVDVTDRIENEKVIKEQQVQILNSSRLSALGEMAGGIAHEINNPLAIIQNSAEDLEDLAEDSELTNESAINESKRIQKTVSRISKIISSLRVFSRDGQNDPLVATKVKDLISDTLELCQSKLKASSVKLTYNIPDENISVLARPVQISQVLLNMITNSLHAVENLEDKWIRIEIIENPESITLAIVDSGKGIPIAVQEKMFQPFFTTKDIGKGTGIGLSISKGVLDSHRSKLEIDNECENTRLYFELAKVQNRLNTAA